MATTKRKIKRAAPTQPEVTWKDLIAGIEEAEVADEVLFRAMSQLNIGLTGLLAQIHFNEPLNLVGLLALGEHLDTLSGALQEHLTLCFHERIQTGDHPIGAYIQAMQDRA